MHSLPRDLQVPDRADQGRAEHQESPPCTEMRDQADQVQAEPQESPARIVENGLAEQMQAEPEQSCADTTINRLPMALQSTTIQVGCTRQVDFREILTLPNHLKVNFKEDASPGMMISAKPDLRVAGGTLDPAKPIFEGKSAVYNHPKPPPKLSLLQTPKKTPPKPPSTPKRKRKEDSPLKNYPPQKTPKLQNL